MLGVAPPSAKDLEAAARAAEALSSGSPLSKPQGTLLGVARPGIAPLRPGVAKTPADGVADEGYEAAPELGATYYRKEDAPPLVLPPGRQLVGGRRFDKNMKLDAPALVPPKLVERRNDKLRKASSRRGIYVMIAGLVLATAAVLFAVLWHGADPLSVQVRAGEAGAEKCSTSAARAVRTGRSSTSSKSKRRRPVQGHRAVLDLESPLKPSATPRLTIGIERPSNGSRNENVRVTARVAYRVRPDLTDARSRSTRRIQIVVEAMLPARRSPSTAKTFPLRDGRADCKRS